MIESQEIIERSVYSALLTTAVTLGYTLDPQKYLPVSAENEAKYKSDLANLQNKPFVGIFGTANNQSKGQKITPRIVVNAKGFYPGAIGMPKEILEKSEELGGWIGREYPYEALDQYIDIHLVANTQEDLRLLHQILFWSIPQRGYIKPYTEDQFLFSGNIFLEVVNFYDTPNLANGVMEKIYEFVIFDSLIGTQDKGLTDVVPIKDISVLLENYGYTLVEVSSDNP